MEASFRDLLRKNLNITKGNCMIKTLLKRLALGSLVAAALQATAQEKKEDGEKAPPREERVLVLDRIIQDGFKMPGSGMSLGPEDIRRHSYADVNRILKKVPGVYLREEDGYGLFPNISLRGVDSTRSAKVTVMEDGILTAPAPYSAPSAYYSPIAARMSGFEVIKGSSQVIYGPHTTGGAINYISTPIPYEETFYFKQLFGDNSEVRSHIYWGDTYEFDAGDLGVLLEYYRRTNSGYRNIQNSGRNSGLNQSEALMKLRWTPNSKYYQYFEFKAAYFDTKANESYLGLSEEDFSRDAYDRYWASQWDQFNSNSTKISLRHYIEFSEKTNLRSTLYYQKFHRNWYKLQDVRQVNGVNLASADRSLSRVLANPTNLGVLQGNTPGTFRVRANNRDYELYGFESVVNHEFELGSTSHELTAGARIHFDRIRRFQFNDTYTADGNFGITSISRGAPGGAGDRYQGTWALALFVQDQIALNDRLTVTPGVRFEQLWFDHTRYDGGRTGDDFRNKTRLNAWAPGVGFTYRLGDLSEEAAQYVLFGGVHRGFSTPTPRGHSSSSNIQTEYSMNYELGLRYLSANKAISAEAALFYTKFEDLIVFENIATGGSDRNVGSVETWGLELSASMDLGALMGWSFNNPWYASATYTSAELASNDNSTDQESIFSGGQSGNEVPYIPQYQLAIGTGIECGKFAAYLDMNYVDEVFSTAANNSTVTTDARDGTADSHITVDFSVQYALTKNFTIQANVHNLFNEEYVAGRHPHGPRAGKPRTLTAGFELKF